MLYWLFYFYFLWFWILPTTHLLLPFKYWALTWGSQALWLQFLERRCTEWNPLGVVSLAMEPGNPTRRNNWDHWRHILLPHPLWGVALPRWLMESREFHKLIKDRSKSPEPTSMPSKPIMVLIAIYVYEIILYFLIYVILWKSLLEDWLIYQIWQFLL